MSLAIKQPGNVMSMQPYDKLVMFVFKRLSEETLKAFAEILPFTFSLFVPFGVGVPMVTCWVAAPPKGIIQY